MYAHEELLQELEITKTDLSKELSTKVGKFSNKKRLTSDPEKLVAMEVESEILADEISEWYEANYEEEDEDEYPTPPVAPVVVAPIVSVDPITPPVAPIEEEEKSGGWGTKRGSW
jgi:hypothetical protein